MENVIYKKDKVFKDEILPKLQEIKHICNRNDIPFISVFATENTEDKTYYQLDGLMPGVKDMKLSDNKLREIYMIVSDYRSEGKIDIDDEDDSFPEELPD